MSLCRAVTKSAAQFKLQAKSVFSQSKQNASSLLKNNQQSFHSQTHATSSAASDSIKKSVSYAALLTAGVGAGLTFLLAPQVVHAEEASTTPAASSFDAITPAPSTKRKKKRTSTVNLPQPGPFQQFDNVVKDTLQMDTFGGARIALRGAHTYPLDPTAPRDPNPLKMTTAALNITLGNPQIEGGSAVEFQTMSKLGQGFMQGSFDVETGRVSGVAKGPLLWGSTGQVQFALGRESMVNLDLEMPGKGWCGTFGIQAGSVAVASFTQSITPKLAIGTQLVIVPFMKTLLDVSARYKDYQQHSKVGEAAILSYSQAQGDLVSLSYTRGVTEFSAFAVELNVSTKNFESKGKAGFAYSRPMYVYKAGVDTDGVTSVTLDQMFNDMIALNFSAEVNQLTREASIGVGFALGQQ